MYSSSYQHYGSAVSTSCGISLAGFTSTKYQMGFDDPVHKKAVNQYILRVSSRYNPFIQFWNRQIPKGYPFYTGTMTSCFGGGGNAPLEFDANDTIKSLNKLHEKTSRATVHAGKSIAEMGKTMDTIASRANKLADMIRAVKSKDPAKIAEVFGKPFGNPMYKYHGSKNRSFGSYEFDPRKASKSEADLWLELQYGWKPICSDISGAIKDIGNRQKSRSANQSFSYTQNKSSVTFSTIAGQVFKNTTVLSRKMKTTVIKPGSQVGDYGLDDLPGILYEVTPYSFVVDWFIPIGDYLQGVHDAFDGAEYGASCVTIKESRRTEWIKSLVENEYSDIVVKGGSGFFSTSFSFSRVPGPLPFPPLPEPKAFSESANLSHVLSALALCVKNFL